MVNRIALVTVWFLTGWMCAAMFAFVVGLPTWIAPVVAVLAAGYIGYWSGQRHAAVAAKTPVEPTPAIPTAAPNA
jgi:hypothetical protein